MLLVILGAGASYDSSSDFLPPRQQELQSHRPPLAIELFQNRPLFANAIDTFPQSRPLIASLRHPPSGTIEEHLGRLRAQAPGHPLRFTQLHALRYYLRRIIWECDRHWFDETHGVTNYIKLLDSLATWQSSTGSPLRIVTFNYDTLIERAMPDALNIRISTIDDYVRHESVKLLKLHGSVNWLHPVPIGGIPNQEIPRHLVALGESLRPEPEIQTVSDGTTDICSRGPGFPALALPVEAKSEFECPPDHVEQLKRDLPSISRVLIVGWRAKEQHFLSLWKEHMKQGAKILIVGAKRQDAESIRGQLMTTGIVGAARCSDAHGFSYFLRGRELDSLLSP